MANETCITHEDGKQEHPLPVVALWKEEFREDGHGKTGPTRYECQVCKKEFDSRLLKFPKF